MQRGVGRGLIRLTDELLQPAHPVAGGLAAGGRGEAGGKADKFDQQPPGFVAGGDAGRQRLFVAFGGGFGPVGQRFQRLKPLFVAANHPAVAGGGIELLGVAGLQADRRPIEIGRAPGIDDRPAGQGRLAIGAGGAGQPQQVEQRGDGRVAGQRQAIEQQNGQLKLGGGLQNKGTVGADVAGQQGDAPQRQAILHHALFQPAQRGAHFGGAVRRGNQNQRRVSDWAGKAGAFRLEQGRLQMGQQRFGRRAGVGQRFGGNGQSLFEPGAGGGKAAVRRAGGPVAAAGESDERFIGALGQQVEQRQLHGGEVIEAVKNEQRPIGGDVRRGGQRFNRQPAEAGAVGPLLLVQPVLVTLVELGQFGQARLGDGGSQRGGIDAGHLEFIEQAAEHLDKTGPVAEGGVVAERDFIDHGADEPEKHRVGQFSEGRAGGLQAVVGQTVKGEHRHAERAAGFGQPPPPTAGLQGGSHHHAGRGPLPGGLLGAPEQIFGFAGAGGRKVEVNGHRGFFPSPPCPLSPRERG